jgi:hypothetical protein
MIHGHPHMFTTNVALIDIDNCFVSNDTSEINLELIQHLKSKRYHKIWFFSGRNGNDSWQHVLKRGKPHPDWKNQLICNLLKQCQEQGIHIDGVSLPYDHVFKCEPGQGYKTYRLAELESKLDKAKGDAGELMSAIQNTTAKTDEEMCLQLALSGDYSKEGQARYLLASFDTHTMTIDYFDDKKDNLEAVTNIVAKHFPFSCVNSFHVDFTQGSKQTNYESIEKSLVEHASPETLRRKCR